MITLFTILMIAFMFGAIKFAINLSWNLLKVIFVIFIIPAALIGLFVSVLSKLALPALVVIGIIMLIKELNSDSGHAADEV